MKKQTKKRKSNYELLKIVSMLMIVIYHVFMHSGMKQSTGTYQMIVYAIVLLTYVHVNCFVLVTGYFQSDNKFKPKKLVSIIGLTWFYRIFFSIVLSCIGWVELSRVDIFNLLSPIGKVDEYWFVNMYLFLYCISPILNKLIHSLTQKEYTKMLLGLTVLLSIIPFVSGQTIIFNNYGQSIASFIFLYLLGAYFKKYPINESYLFKRYNPSLNQLLYFILFFVFFAINFMVFNLGNVLSLQGPISKQLGNFAIYAIISYDNPFLILQSLMFFFWFGTFKINSKVINYINSLTFGIYLIHENFLLRNVLYTKIGFTEYVQSQSYFSIVVALVIAVLLFISSGLLESIRQLITNFIARRKIIQQKQQRLNNWYYKLCGHSDKL